MSDAIKFSVIVPVHNVQGYLRTALDSVRGQAYCNWECICIDDGSTDESGRMLDEIASEDSRFVIIHQNNLGVSEARNSGLKVARGEFVTFLDADDVVDSEWLVNYLSVFEAFGADLVRINYMEFADGENLPTTVNRSGRVRLIEESDGVFVSEVCKHGYVWACAYRRAKQFSLLFCRGVVFAEDTLFNLKFISQAIRAVQSDYDGYFYRTRPGSGSHRKLSNGEWMAFIKAWAEFVTQSSSPVVRGFAFNLLWCDSTVFVAESAGLEELRELRCVLRDIIGRGRHIELTCMKFHWRVVLSLFLVLGMVWPVKVLRRVLDKSK